MRMREGTVYRVYPRACGETTLSHRNLQLPQFLEGLSPRLRGNPGKRPVDHKDMQSGGLSPRLRGNHNWLHCQWTTLSYGGLSPRLRGNLGRHGQSGSGPIMKGLSPRLRGNRNHEQRRLCTAVEGLSPRLRGNRVRARTGPLPYVPVYPRACGETTRYPGRQSDRSPAGLSPRLRGNLRVDGRPRLPRGSIPAPAGKPLSASWPQLLVPV